MRRPGREFGSEKPTVIYVALRWNDAKPTPYQEDAMVKSVAKRLGGQRIELRIFNLVRPAKGRGMTLSIDEYSNLEDTLLRIKEFLKGRQAIQRIVVGGRSGPMPLVALLLKFLVPKVRIEIRNHHRARAANGGPLRLVRVIRP